MTAAPALPDGGAQGWLEAPHSTAAVTAFAVVLTLIIAIGDFLTGPYLVFATFYLVPVALAAWFVGRTTGLLIAALASITGLIGTALDPQAVPPPVYIWNAGFRFITYAFVATIVSAQRSTMNAIHTLASTDPLTLLLNRRRFYERVDIELARARRAGDPVAVVYIDVDELKQRNDTFGHDVGDAMLIGFAEIATATLRRTDLLARMGGDEFCFLLPGANLAAAQDIIERLRERLEDADPLPVHFSAGILSGPAPDDIDVESIVRSADLLMLAAKASGKGRSQSQAGLTNSSRSESRSGEPRSGLAG